MLNIAAHNIDRDFIRLYQLQQTRLFRQNLIRRIQKNGGKLAGMSCSQQQRLNKLIPNPVVGSSIQKHHHDQPPIHQQQSHPTAYPPPRSGKISILSVLGQYRSLFNVPPQFVSVCFPSHFSPGLIGAVVDGLAHGVGWAFGMRAMDAIFGHRHVDVAHHHGGQPSSSDGSATGDRSSSWSSSTTGSSPSDGAASSDRSSLPFQENLKQSQYNEEGWQWNDDTSDDSTGWDGFDFNI